ncbi:hypothetical protein [Pseudonocardia broussonetiae]|uniref:Uncharacterized protein n=1 Tax=Pseudonocardia broussonetiae TaxID=2736640 RepID=A0A6M6JKE0_9PSEU|nr:hypothetical protein [Pseudonocardia broussonetiae]QJY47826.1 hypothetical protein HOP40_20080 [Pseudonocardia broussonetiae]
MPTVRDESRPDSEFISISCFAGGSMRQRRYRVRTGLTLLRAVVLTSAVLAAAAGCGSAGPTDAPLTAASPVGATTEARSDTVFVGRSADGTVAVAIAVHDGRATGFISDGLEVGVWFDGAATGGLLDLRTADGSTLVGGIHGRVIHGGVTRGDAEWSFVALQGEEPTGLYTAASSTDTDDRIGWIRFPDDTVVGTADIGGSLRPAPGMTPAITVEGARFEPLHRVVGGTEVGAG